MGANGLIELLFLGTGTSMGVPVVGCDCPVCLSGDPRDTRTRASVYVVTPEVSLVVDTGVDFRAQCLREGIRRIDAVLYTHAHTDHVMGLDDLRPFSGVERPMPIYASPDTMADLRRVFAFAFDGKHRFPGYVCLDPREIAGPFLLGETRVDPLPALHGRATVLGFLFSRGGVPLLAYLSDCKTVPEPTAERMAGVRVLVVDALRQTPHPTHMNFAEALAFSRKIGAGETWFTHLSHDAGHADSEALLPDGVRIAHDGLRIRAG